MSAAIVVAVGTTSCSSSNIFGTISTFRKVTPVRLPPGRFRLATRPISTGSAMVVKTIGMVAVVAVNQFGRQGRQPIVLIFGPAIFDCDVPALGKAGLAQASKECGYRRGPVSSRCTAK